MTDPMRIGLMTFVTDQSMPVTPLAREAEGRGFESLFVPEKTHLPVSRRTP
jgi:alkanesulfonate monooxygenase SsuD/methylene tetrahydromethanopterin reductase-like flavin-dependent oxidoreductase (luciferase family)